VRENAQVPLPVSVQICTLNEEENIGECLETVLANDPEEMVVIDGGSTDRTVEIAESLGARVLAPGRLGLGPSRQLGWRSTACCYTAFVDADDRLPSDWLATMVSELEAGGYTALQSSLRAIETDSWWTSGWNQYFIESVKPTAETTMVGRPALFVTAELLREDEDLISLDEDTHLSRRFELRGLRQGIGTAVAYRHVEETWSENSRKWESYGRGYRGFVAEHPERRVSILRHMLWTIPVERSVGPLIRGKVRQPAFGLAMSVSILRGWFSKPPMATATSFKSR
jgi:glycosyltransferase involved in cell wall biosynthesis